jgi:hypothetical protein
VGENSPISEKKRPGWIRTYRYLFTGQLIDHVIIDVFTYDLLAQIMLLAFLVGIFICM